MSGGLGRLTIRSELSELERLFAFLDAFCARHDVPSELRLGLALVVEELTVNVIGHGYGGRPDGHIDIALECREHCIVLRLEDAAPPFDPLGKAPVPDTEASIDDRSIGGLGVHLARTLTKTIAYRYEGGRNMIEATFQPKP